ncbi:MAG: GntR family transcriptional regulator [Alphaproteobacteria bacterium]|nr:GntR family transcriptional regulator [Alphaproteobacteria bacterium]
MAIKPDPDRRHKYVIIREWLTEQITDGRFACGQQIPSEHDVMARFGVSRVTARQALSDLCRAGIIEARRGKGYFVRPFTATTNLERLQGFGETMAPLGVATSTDVLEITESAAPPVVSSALRLDSNAIVTRIIRLRQAAGNVISISENYFPVKLGRRLMRLDLARQDLYVLMEKRLGIDLAFADAELEVTQVNPTYARFLGVGEKDLVTRVIRIVHDSAGRPLAHEFDYSSLKAIRFRIRIPRW